MMILSFIFIFPLSNKYAKTYKDLDDLTTPLENYALKIKIFITTNGLRQKNWKPACMRKNLKSVSPFSKKRIIVWKLFSS